MNWVTNTLGIEPTANILWNDDERFEFRLFASPDSLEAAIRRKVAQGISARMTAGYCWKWTDPRPDGTLVEDVVIGDYRRPWNAKPDAGKLARGIPKASLWASRAGRHRAGRLRLHGAGVRVRLRRRDLRAGPASTTPTRANGSATRSSRSTAR